MRKLFTLKKDNKVKKGFTILELLVVVAIIAILAVIATPQFLGAIDKSRVSAEIADITGIGQAVTMYNFDTSSFPLANVTGAAVATGDAAYTLLGTFTPGTGVTDPTITGPFNPLLTNTSVALRAPAANTSVLATNSIVGWNGPYMTTYPNVNRWGGAVAYNVVQSSGASQKPAVIGTVAAGVSTAGSVYDGVSGAANTITGLMSGQIVIELDAIPAADAGALKKGIDSVASTGGSSSTGQLRIDATTVATPTCYYVIH